MLRRSLRYFCAPASSSTTTTSSPPAAGTSPAAAAAAPRRITPTVSSRAEIFQMRKSPYGLQGKTLHSHLLTDHALTQKAARNEALYRQRQLESRAKIDADAKVEAEKLAAETAATPEGERYIELKWIYIMGVCGYLGGHVVGHHLFGEEDMRLPYDPVNGYLNDIEESHKKMKDIDSEVEHHVVGFVLQGRSQQRHSALH